MSGLFTHIDCIELYVSDLDEGINYYCGSLGLKLLWRSETSLGLGMENDITEVVLQTVRKKMDVSFKVDSVADSIERVIEAGGKIVEDPFDIPIGKCAIIQDKWENQYVILDMTKGKYVTDEEDRGTVHLSCLAPVLFIYDIAIHFFERVDKGSQRSL